MKVKTNFKKMFLVDSPPTNDNNENGLNDNAILNKFIESSEGDKSITINENNRDTILDEENRSDNNENRSDNNENKSQINNKNVDGINEISEVHNKFINNNKDENGSPSCENTPKDFSLKKHKNTSKDFNLKKCLDDCFNKSSINHENNKNIDYTNPNDEDNDTFMEVNDVYNDDNGDYSEGEDEKEFSLRLKNLRENNEDNEDNDISMQTDDDNEGYSAVIEGKDPLRSKNKKTLKSKKKKFFVRPHNNLILSKYKHQKYIPRRNLPVTTNKNLKRKFITREEILDGDKRKKYDDNKSIQYVKNETNKIESDISDMDYDSSIEDDNIDNEYSNNERSYSLRKYRRKNQRYQDYDLDYVENSLVCKLCDNEFKNEKALNNHIKTCRITSFSCSICGKNYKTRWGLQNHIMNMHSKKKKNS